MKLPQSTTGALACALAVTLMSAACAHAPRASLGQLQQRAVLDAGCPAQWLALQHLDARTKVVTGCGVQLVYVESCEDARGQTLCSWLLDSARAAPGAARAPSPPVANAPGVLPIAGWGPPSVPAQTPAAVPSSTASATYSPPEAPARVRAPIDWLGPDPEPGGPNTKEYRPNGL
jgi:hypothetical protein